MLGPAGLRIRLDAGRGSFDLLPVPGAVSGADFNYRLGGGLLRFDAAGGAWDSSVTSGVSARDTAEVRIVELTAREPER